jgi:hypothetical protein
MHSAEALSPARLQASTILIASSTKVCERELRWIFLSSLLATSFDAPGYFAASLHRGAVLSDVARGVGPYHCLKVQFQHVP